MENIEGLEKKHGGPDRIIGVDNKIEAYLKLVEAEKVLKNQELTVFEREKTPEEMEIIYEVFERLPDFIREYGADQKRFISSKQVHILDETSPHTKGIRSFLERDTPGRYSPSSGRIEILPEGLSYVRLAHVLVHELMHVNSFFSITSKKDGEGTEQSLRASFRRFGVSVNEKGKTEESLFNFINEAVTEELTKRFCEKYFQDIRLLRDSFIALKDKKKQVEFLDSPTFSVLGELLDPQSLYSYTNERAGFASLVELLYEKNKNEFDSYEDVFKLFSQAMFKGHLLPIARLIEKTFGKGSFRTIGQKTKDESPSVVDTLSSLYADSSPEPKDKSKQEKPV